MNLTPQNLTDINNNAFANSSENKKALFSMKYFDEDDKSLTSNTNYFSNSTFDYSHSNETNGIESEKNHGSSNSNIMLEKIVEQAKLIFNLNRTINSLTAISNKDHELYKNINSDLTNSLKEYQENQLISRDLEEDKQLDVIETIEETNPKILFYGVCKLNTQEITQLVKDKLEVSYKIKINDSDITIMTSEDSKTLKNRTPVNQLKTNNYDYLLVGPHPHSIKGKNIKHSWGTFLKNKNLKTKSFETYTKPLSKEQIIVFLKEIGDDLFGRKLKK